MKNKDNTIIPGIVSKASFNADLRNYMTLETSPCSFGGFRLSSFSFCHEVSPHLESVVSPFGPVWLQVRVATRTKH